jgi:diadenosine tetraphosphate (Ap4A) HIT family hydrolase
MGATLEKTGNRVACDEIEIVDHAHWAWNEVMALIERTADAAKLQLDPDGWLSARQIVLVAFVDGKPVAHLSFHIEPSRGGCVEARLDTYGIDDFHADRGIEHELWVAAVARAHELR